MKITFALTAFLVGQSAAFFGRRGEEENKGGAEAVPAVTGGPAAPEVSAAPAAPAAPVAPVAQIPDGQLVQIPDGQVQVRPFTPAPPLPPPSPPSPPPPPAPPAPTKECKPQHQCGCKPHTPCDCRPRPAPLKCTTTTSVVPIEGTSISTATVTHTSISSWFETETVTRFETTQHATTIPIVSTRTVVETSYSVNDPVETLTVVDSSVLTKTQAFTSQEPVVHTVTTTAYDTYRATLCPCPQYTPYYGHHFGIIGGGHGGHHW